MGQTCCHGSSDHSRSESKAGVKYHQSWTVNGMDCPSCVQKLQTALENAKEISVANVGFSTKKLQVTYANGIAETIGASVVATVVRQLGFNIQSKDSHSAASEKIGLKAKRNVFVYWSGVILLIITAMVLWEVQQSWSHIVFSAATLWGLYPVAKKAYYQARRGILFGIETLMSVACIGALFLGDYSEAALVLVLFRLGEYLEGVAAGKARKGVEALMNLTPDRAFLLREGKRQEVSASELMPGDTIELRPGDRLPVDGELLEAASLDQSALTGESLPVEKMVGESVMAGTLVVGRRITLKVTSEPGNNAIDRVLHLIEEADSHKAPVERFINQFSRRYTPIMIFIALLTALIPTLFFGQAWDVWIYRALALLLIACPCALVISTPAAVTSALACAARMGGLIKGGAVLERLASVKNIAFDKTGTLTEGALSVSEIHNASENTEWFSLAASVEQGSSHPLAKAVLAEAKVKDLKVSQAESVEVIVGKGVRGLVSGQEVAIASPRYLRELFGHAVSQVSGVDHWIKAQESTGKTVVGVCVDHALSGLIAFSDTVREDAADSIRQLKNMGVDSVMLTGDNSRSAAHIAEKLGIEFKAELLPEDKVNAVMALKSAGDVLMVGDGINDAPALKAADIGIAMGKGSDAALEIADAALTHERLTSLVGMISISQRTHNIIRQNIGWALGIKLVVLGTTLFGITGLMVAVLADAGAAAAVTLNSLRLLRKK